MNDKPLYTPAIGHPLRATGTALPTDSGTGEAAEMLRRTRVRMVMLAMLVLVTIVNYADRATMSLAGPAMAKDLGLSSVSMGYVFSAFAWSYVLAQVPGGWLLDRFGSKVVYFFSIFLWSLFTLMQGGVFTLGATAAIYALFTLRLLVGAAEAPSFPANGRIVAAWFPTAERGTASAIFASASYFAVVIFAPLMGWLTFNFGWQYVFLVMGGLGILTSFLWLKLVKNPKDHPRVNQAEMDYIAAGGALVDLDSPGEGKRSSSAATALERPLWQDIKALLANRMLLAIYVGQYCISALTYFFLTWFPVYLVQQRHMSILNAGFVASIPAICGFIGGVLGGGFSDLLLRKTGSTTVARKVPIVLGMLLSTTMVACNYINVQWIIIAVMAAAFFGKGMGALGWAVIADTSPKQIAGLSGALFNTFGNAAGITTPIAIGYIVHETGSFDGALLFVAAHALGAILCYLIFVGKIQRVELSH